MAAGYFSLLAQRESNQEKTAPSDPRRSRSERFAAGERVRPTGHPWPVVRNRRDPSRRPRFARLFRSPFAASQRDPKAALTLALSRKRERGCVVLRVVMGFGASAAGTAALFALPGPLSAAASRWRISRRQRWRAQDAARVRREHRDVLPANPGACSRSHARRDARVTADARVSFLWLLSFGQAKESNRRPWMADDPHTDVSRFSRQRQKQGRQDQNGFRPSPE